MAEGNRINLDIDAVRDLNIEDIFKVKGVLKKSFFKIILGVQDFNLQCFRIG